MPDGRTVTVLSIDGGGIRGLVPALILHRLHELVREADGRDGDDLRDVPFAGLFDLLAGTSTGGIIATGLAAPDPGRPGRALLTPEDLVGLYRDQGGRIFPQPGGWLGRRWAGLRNVFAVAYDAAPLEEILDGLVGDAPLSRTTVNLMVSAYDIERRDVTFFKNRRFAAPDSRYAPPGYEDPDHRLKHVARATSAAPTFFEPARVFEIGREDDDEAAEHLIDGGVYVNNPAMCAYVEARKLFPSCARVVLVTLGTGVENAPIAYDDAKGWGFGGWARPSGGVPILRVMMDGQSDNAHYQMRQLLNTRDQTNYYRFDAPLPGDRDVGLDDASDEALEYLAGFAAGIIADNEDALREVAGLLLAVRAEREASG